MNKNDLLFYSAYEEFYEMAEKSKTFGAFCQDAFGSDFSQDGFSNKAQIDILLKLFPHSQNLHILDIGCGNGKMLGYLQSQTGAFIHGFDYSKQAIKTASKLYNVNADFKEGVIGEIQYPINSFDVIISMDTMYFTDDMSAFVSDIKKWMKPNALFFVGYTEGDVISKTESVETTKIAKAFFDNQMSFNAIDITYDTYNLLKKKRQAAIVHKSEFENEENMRWFDLLMCQTDCINCSYNEFKKRMARYIFIATK